MQRENGRSHGRPQPTAGTSAAGQRNGGPVSLRCDAASENGDPVLVPGSRYPGCFDRRDPMRKLAQESACTTMIPMTELWHTQLRPDWARGFYCEGNPVVRSPNARSGVFEGSAVAPSTGAVLSADFGVGCRCSNRSAPSRFRNRHTDYGVRQREVRRREVDVWDRHEADDQTAGVPAAVLVVGTAQAVGGTGLE
jgi:hypothetical protein